jgi:hypothetical protein
VIASRYGAVIATTAAVLPCGWALTIVLHGLEIEADEVWEEKIILGKVPCPVTDLHGIRIVRGGAGRRHVVQRRHDGGSADRPWLTARQSSNREAENLVKFFFFVLPL